MATAKQKQVFKKMVENVGKGKPVKMGELMLEANYSPAMARNPQKLTTSKNWQELVKTYLQPAEQQAVKTFFDLTAETNEDKDNRLKASIETLKIQDRYPKGETKIVGIFNKIEQISDKD
jgi:hypothetical protein